MRKIIYNNKNDEIKREDLSKDFWIIIVLIDRKKSIQFRHYSKHINEYEVQCVIFVEDSLYSYYPNN